MNDIYSFYQLISKYQIEIPIIQRDYAQGRNNPKAADVRKSLVDNMIKAVKEDKPLFFDFVYGRVDNNKFIPFDGQQRLTTLFLFHKYVFEKCQSDSDCNHKDNCSCRSILGRFSYATRQSSREFCEKLVENNIIPDDKYKTQLRETFIAELKKEVDEKEKKADEFIKSIDNWIYRFVTNQPWFYPDWEKDPTIMGMLTMLDEIHCQMRNETDFKTFAEKLTSGCNCPITFHFVDMGEHKLSDETYVNMNARGKTLTPFENFKARLEQYLEEKNEQELLSRLKGKYDESKQKYTGIDGSWLDLFWEVTNKEKQENEGKELPDSLMMSFFNRHFMNVWRCWYENNSKTEKERNSLNDEQKKEQDEQDEFNKRIQEEMPLYPTKDDFVTFEIYSYVLDNCGVDECLTPIFNIWDTLYDKSKKNDNSILNDCQTVWNRKDEGSKWNLYQGDKNKDNRETYPSRVAFYALMKYFKNSKDTASLPQWMRVVWNIIENSTIDSSDTYHAALRLIEKLSAKSHTIYNALANEFESFELGNQYHAQEQVAEEIAKAKQILDGRTRADGKTWEDIIIEAEKYAFFKGAIRFLFTDGEGNISWCDFDTKWENIKRYFDKNGEIVEKYKTNAILLRALLSRINIGENWFGYYKVFWHTSLLNSAYKSAIHYLLTTPQLVIEKTCGQDWIIHDSLLYELLCCYNSWHILDNWKNYDVLTRYSQRRSDATSHKEIVVLNDLRNKLLNSNDIEIPQEHKVAETIYLYGWNINFKYKNHFFRWYGYPNEEELDVYLMEDNWAGYKKRQNPTNDKGTEEDNYYCFRVTPDMESNTSLFIEELDRLIDEASQNS